MIGCPFKEDQLALLCGKCLLGGGWSGARGLVRALKESQEGDGYAARLGVCQEELERREGIPCVFWTYITKSQLA